MCEYVLHYLNVSSLRRLQIVLMAYTSTMDPHCFYLPMLLLLAVVAATVRKPLPGSLFLVVISSATGLLPTSSLPHFLLLLPSSQSFSLCIPGAAAGIEVIFLIHCNCAFVLCHCWWGWRWRSSWINAIHQKELNLYIFYLNCWMQRQYPPTVTCAARQMQLQLPRWEWFDGWHLSHSHIRKKEERKEEC